MMRNSDLHWCEADFVLGRLILRIRSRILGRVGLHRQDLLLGASINGSSGALPRGSVGGIGRDGSPVYPGERRKGSGQRARSRRRERDAVRRGGTGIATFPALELHIVLREALDDMVSVEEGVLAVDCLEALFR